MDFAGLLGPIPTAGLQRQRLASGKVSPEATRMMPLCQVVGIGHQPTWQQLLARYGLTEAEAREYKQNPIDVLKPIADAAVPILHIVSDDDRVVPPSENTYVLQQRYRQLGGIMRVMSIEKGTAKSNGHHFTHPDPLTPAEFIVNHSIGPRDWFTLRCGLGNCRLTFERKKRGRVAFLGGSITHNSGWREMVCRAIQRRFPETKFDFINAGIPSTGSTPGAFRLVRDVFGRGAVDLLFVEAAVNDSANSRNPIEMLRGMEGIVRHARLVNPKIDIVVMHFVDPSKMAQYNEGRELVVIAQHEKVARRYRVASMNLALEGTGIIEYRVDDGPWRTRDLFTQWSQHLHIPWAHILEAELADQAHRLTMRVAQSRNPKSRGNAVRIVHFLVNE